MRVRIEAVEGGGMMPEAIMEGVPERIPTVGDRLMIWLDRNKHDDRYFHTSKIKEVTLEGKEFIVTTMNSVYKVTILQEDIDEALELVLKDDVQ